MARIKDRQFYNSRSYNNRYFMHYYNRLLELSISMFEWKNLPPNVDSRYLELVLFSNGQAVFFHDRDLADSNLMGNSEDDGYLAMAVAPTGNFDIYGYPVKRRAFSHTNSYTVDNLDRTNSVMIYNNTLRTNTMLDIELFAKRLADLDRIVDINTSAQKTPILIVTDQNQKFSMEQVYKKYEGGEPVIFGDKGLTNNPLSVLKTDAPFIADDIYRLKAQIWNEALTYLGISNVNINKKERLLQDEVTRNLGGTIASRYTRLDPRRQACKEINKLFGLNIWVDFKEDYQEINPTQGDTIEGEPNSDGTGGTIGEGYNE